MNYTDFELSVRWILREVCYRITTESLSQWIHYPMVKYIIPQYLYASEFGKYPVQFDVKDFNIDKTYSDPYVNKNTDWKDSAVYVLNLLCQKNVLSVDKDKILRNGRFLDSLHTLHEHGVTGQTCNTCRQFLSFESFTPAKNAYFKLAPKCRECNKKKKVPIVEAPRVQPSSLSGTDLLESLCTNPIDEIRKRHEENAVSLYTVDRFKKAGLNVMTERQCEACDTVYPITMFSISKKPGYIHRVCKACWEIDKNQAMFIQYGKIY